MIIENKKCSAYVCPRMVKAHNSCIGSDCMAWRWHKLPNPEFRPGMHPLPNMMPYTYSETHGYCGLAGNP